MSDLSSKTVMVTGATGYVAGQLIKKLLEEGITVHATVRDPKREDKLKYLNQLAQNSPGSIQYFKADLLEENSFDEAVKGCQIIFHTASPFTLNVKDPQTDLVNPAKLGTRNVLKSANKESSVKKVVLTSSCAAIYGDNIDLLEAPQGVLTEENWNTSSSLTHNAYFFSKAEAEKEAWSLHEKQNQWDLVTINPSLVMGPGINPHATSESFNLIRQFGDGRLKSGTPDMGLGVVDVRDVAEAHFQAAFNAKAKGRYITSGHNTSFPEIAKILSTSYGNKYPIPKKTLPKWLVWIAGPLIDQSMTRKFISRNVGYPWKADNSKSRNELGLSYRPLGDTVNDFFKQMVDNQAF